MQNNQLQHRGTDDDTNIGITTHKLSSLDSFSNLSDNRSNASSKTVPPHSAI